MDQEKEKRVMIGIPTLFPYVHTNFWKSWMKLAKPNGHLVMVATGSITSVARNKIVEHARFHKCSHVMFLDSDMTFPQDAIQKLMSHDKDIVCGLYFQRDHPHLPAAIIGETGRISKDDISSRRLKEIDAAGTGCMLIKTDVFDKIGYPWFDYQVYDGYTYYTEDVIFCRKAKKLGYRLFVDTSIRCGHIIDYELSESDYKEEVKDGS